MKMRTTRRENWRAKDQGSSAVAALFVLMLLILLLVSILNGVSIEQNKALSLAAGEQARFSAASGGSAAMSLLMLACSSRPGYLVGLTNTENSGDTAPCVVIGATNLESESQMIPLLSCDLTSLLPFPKLPSELLGSILEKRLSTNTAIAVDLNDPLLLGRAKTDGGMIASRARYPALWQYLHDSTGTIIGRYAFVMTDESARLNPRLHLGNSRMDPSDWDHGPSDIPLSNGTADLPNPEEAALLTKIAGIIPGDGGFRSAFHSSQEYESMHNLLTSEDCRSPDLIPPGLVESGMPKYNLNDLATNQAWGRTPYDRAIKIASVIDLNLPKFKQRDPSIQPKGSDPTLYLKRLACSIVDYISRDTDSTGPPGGEPSGSDLVPCVTKIAERCTRTAQTSNSVTSESRIFAEVWNPTTSTIPAGGIPRLRLLNRAIVDFGTGISRPFHDYDKTAPPLSQLRPNEFTVIDFGPDLQTWTSPDTTTNPPVWANGPSGNADTLHPQSLEFFWNGHLAGVTRHPPICPGDVWGGLHHLGQSLGNDLPHWQCMTLPTCSGTTEKNDQPDEADEAIHPGDYGFVGDPRAMFLSSCPWGVTTNYLTMTLWKGIVPAGVKGKGFLMDPMETWTSRDRVPLNPFAGNSPPSIQISPDQIPSPYSSGYPSSEAPFVIRKGPMLSLGELGNVFDPAQADDAGQAPLGGFPKTRYYSGGGRTLRIGQPEFQFSDSTANWNVQGKRAIDLLDLFTLADTGRQPGVRTSTNTGVPGRINVNTASHSVLKALFTGIAVTSDRRFTNSVIGESSADNLATIIEQHRPYSRLSDLSVLTTNLANADTFSPPLSKNVPGSSPPVADVFDRAREEGFGKLIGHCIVTSRTFRLFVTGEALDRSGKTSARSVMEAIVRLEPDESGNLLPSLQEIRWR